MSGHKLGENMKNWRLSTQAGIGRDEFWEFDRH